MLFALVRLSGAASRPRSFIRGPFMSNNSKKQIKSVSLVFIITLSGKILGLLRDIFFGQSYGTDTPAAQAFLAASRIPRTFFDAIFASAISSSFIPVFNEYLEKKGKDEAYRLANSFLTVIGLFTAVISVLGVIFSSQLPQLLYHGFSPETSALSAMLLKILSPMILFTGIAYSMVGILQSQGKFNIPAALSTVSNGIIILYLIFFNDKFGITGVAVAYLIGWAMQMLMQVPSLNRLGYRYRPSIRHEGLKTIFLLMIPVMVSTWIQPLNFSISSYFGSGLFEGEGVSALEYANSLYTVVAGVFVLSVVNVIFPNLSKLSVNNKKDEFAQVVKSTSISVLFLLIPLTAGVMILSEPLIRLLYERGAFTTESTLLTSRALTFMSIGMIGFGLQTILSRAFYSMKKGKIPLISGIVSVTVNLVLSYLFVGKWDVAGLALASALALIVAAVVMIIPMHKMTGSYIDKGICISFIKMVAAALIMGAAVIIMRNILLSALSDTMIARIIVVAVPAAIGVIVYILFAKLFRLEQTNMISSLINKVLGRRRQDS